ncbi:VOC family protein [Streptomyces sp. NPDC092296]|uniref:VOC family protein n=1 Tax=Streptomyces sp. NPDC092296 TaxID=3366012 RepID=UPI003826D50E
MSKCRASHGRAPPVQHGVPADEWDEGAYLCDPEGAGPHLSFLKVPEPKAVKNRVHVDVQVGGGRETPWEGDQFAAVAKRATA